VFDIDEQWDTASNISLTIFNQSVNPVNSWQVSWEVKDGETLKESWNARCSQHNNTVTCTNEEYNSTIDAKGGSVSFGATFHTPGGITSRPRAFVVNGVTINNN
jgi:hypothetical protein